MWPVTRRIRATVADARLNQAVIETLESRRLLAAAAPDVGAPPSEWELLGADGEHRGTATLVDGILHVVTTSGNDYILIGTGLEPGSIYVSAMSNSGISQGYSRVQGVQVDTSRLRGLLVDAGDGNDAVEFLNCSGLVNLPTTINGGGGDDDLMGETDRDLHDAPVAFHKDQHSYAKVVLNGGNGNDRLEARIGDTTLIGGAGDDQFVTNGSWGHNTIVDDQFAPPVVKPIDVPPAPPADVPPVVTPSPKPAPTVTADPAPSTTVAPVPVAPAPPPTFSTTPVTAPAASLFADHATGGVWD